jgi:hypothetical protein
MTAPDVIGHYYPNTTADNTPRLVS